MSRSYKKNPSCRDRPQRNGGSVWGKRVRNKKVRKLDRDLLPNKGNYHKKVVGYHGGSYRRRYFSFQSYYDQEYRHYLRNLKFYALGYRSQLLLKQINDFSFKAVWLDYYKAYLMK